MSTILATLGGVGVLCGAGIGVSSLFKFFHSYDLDVPSGKKSKSSRGREEGGGKDDRSELMSSRSKSRS